MSSSISRTVRSNALGLVAIFIALTGTAIAAQTAATNSVLSRSIKNGQVKKPDLAGNAVRGDANVLDGTISGLDVLDDSLGADELANDSVGSPEVAANAIGNSEMADSAVGSAEVAVDSLAADDLGEDSVAASELANDSVVGANVTDRSLGLVDVAVAHSGQIDVNLPSIPANSCVDKTLNVLGAQTTDIVVFTPPPTLPDGVIVGARKSAGANQIIFRSCNVATSASADPASAALSFAVFR